MELIFGHSLLIQVHARIKEHRQPVASRNTQSGSWRKWMITWLLRTKTSRGGNHPFHNNVAATELVRSNALGQPGKAQDTPISATGSNCSLVIFFQKNCSLFFLHFYIAAYKSICLLQYRYQVLDVQHMSQEHKD